MCLADIDITKEEWSVVTLVRLNHSEQIDSFDIFRDLMVIAQKGGRETDPIDVAVGTDFDFDGDFEFTVETVVDNGWVDDEGGYKITEEGHNVYRRTDEVSMDEFKTLKMSKSLYNR